MILTGLPGGTISIDSTHRQIKREIPAPILLAPPMPLLPTGKIRSIPQTLHSRDSPFCLFLLAPEDCSASLCCCLPTCFWVASLTEYSERVGTLPETLTAACPLHSHGHQRGVWTRPACHHNAPEFNAHRFPWWHLYSTTPSIGPQLAELPGSYLAEDTGTGLANLSG